MASLGAHFIEQFTIGIRRCFDMPLGLCRQSTLFVENGRVTLKGAVATELESQLASQAANRVSGTYEVRNELRIDN